ncbi:MAG: hypothetical protein IPH04_07230 [Saprospirales bacterium]|jgi:hypothetical protein|nr:hypothetical protein [Saprospirales bacterium]MBK7335623.1 hypothetical protein [Saprospirales bacterium]
MKLGLHTLLVYLALFGFLGPLFGQTPSGGRISGNLEANGNFFLRDTLIGAANTPQYDRQIFGSDAWLNLNYSNWGFDFSIRFDVFNNSNLLNPQGSYTDLGIGRWYIHKEVENFDFSAGYLYDQIGSGIIFRSYEQRALLIDNALVGLRVGYNFGEHLRVKAFSGLQKQQFELYKSVIAGASIEYFLLGKEGSRFTWAPGFGVVRRTLDDATMNNLVATINTYKPTDAFVPRYTAYAFSLYHTLNLGPFVWYAEGAFKTKDNMSDPLAERVTITGDTIVGKLIQAPGSVIYTSLSYANKGLGLTLEGKRTENFSFRTRPQEELNRGLINFLPPMMRVNTYRLTARYMPATQEFGELAVQADARYAISKRTSVNVNFSNITDLNGKQLYRELFTELLLKKARVWQLTTGVQFQRYNQQVYFFKPGEPLLENVTPYVDFLYRYGKRRSVRFEAQYMFTGEDSKGLGYDYGDWVFGLVEISPAAKWTFTFSDMYNIGPGKNSPSDATSGKKLSVHFPRFDIFYTHGANRFSLSYVKQVEGVVCTGGVCRIEPAFSGVKVAVNSSF